MFAKVSAPDLQTFSRCSLKWPQRFCFQIQIQFLMQMYSLQVSVTETFSLLLFDVFSSSSFSFLSFTDKTIKKKVNTSDW